MMMMNDLINKIIKLQIDRKKKIYTKKHKKNNRVRRMFECQIQKYIDKNTKNRIGPIIQKMNKTYDIGGKKFVLDEDKAVQAGNEQRVNLARHVNEAERDN